MLIEIVSDVREFLSKVNPNYTLHYEIDAKIGGSIGELAVVRLVIYGIADDRIVVCEITRTATWEDEEVERYGRSAMENLRLWIEENAMQLECMASKLNATRGRYEWKC